MNKEEFKIEIEMGIEVFYLFVEEHVPIFQNFNGDYGEIYNFCEGLCETCSADKHCSQRPNFLHKPFISKEDYDKIAKLNPEFLI